MEIISDLSEIYSGAVILCKTNEVIMPAYILNNFNDIYYIYVQNRIMAIEMQHTVENDPITGDLCDKWYQIDSTLICDYCIIPEADYILKEVASFLKLKCQRRCKMLIVYFYIVRIQPYYPLLYYYLTKYYGL